MHRQGYNKFFSVIVRSLVNIVFGTHIHLIVILLRSVETRAFQLLPFFLCMSIYLNYKVVSIILTMCYV